MGLLNGEREPNNRASHDVDFFTIGVGRRGEGGGGVVFFRKGD